jgi:hypothetical protein
MKTKPILTEEDCQEIQAAARAWVSAVPLEPASRAALCDIGNRGRTCE